MTGRRGRVDKGGGGLVLLTRNSIRYQEIMMAGPFNQYVMGRETIGNICRVVVLICNPPKNFKERKQIYNNNNKGLIRMVQEAAKHTVLRDG